MTIPEILHLIAVAQDLRNQHDVGSLEWQAVNDQLGDLFRQLANATEGKNHE